MPEKITITCTKCGRTAEVKPTKAGNDRVPSGWKRHNGVWCATCWKANFKLRAVAFPVVGIEDGEWDDFRAAMRLMWQQTTQMANWATTQLHARDVRRETGVAKMPPMPRVYLYPEAREQFPDMPSQSTASLLQAVEGKYRAHRYAVIWTCEESLPNHKYPTPFPVHNQGWCAAFNEGNQPTISARVGDRRWQLRVMGGRRYHRQLTAFRQIVDGAAVQGELSLYLVRADGHGRFSIRRNGQQIKCDLMAKLVAWLPKPVVAREREGILFVRTDAHSMMIALNEKDETLWSYHGRHIVRWVAEHRKRLQEWADDSKFENRPVPTFAARRDAMAEKQRNRLKTAVQDAAAQLVGYARRRKFAGVKFTQRDVFCDPFPWFMLRERIAVLCDEYGLDFEFVQGGASGETA